MMVKVMEEFKNITVLICDGKPDLQGDSFDIKNIEFLDCVPIHENFDPRKPIGTAKLKLDGNILKANLSLSTKWFQKSQLLVPAIQGRAGRTNNNIIEKFSIDGISMVDKNADERIKPLTINLEK